MSAGSEQYAGPRPLSESNDNLIAIEEKVESLSPATMTTGFVAQSDPPFNPPSLVKRKSLFFRADQDMLEFKDMSFAATDWQGHVVKTVISGVSGSLISGNVLAVMGPSGAGKTTLLNTLTLKHRGGMSSGSLKLNGVDLTWGVFKATCASMSQEDSLWSCMTTREHIEFAAGCCLDETPSQRENKVEDLLGILGLSDCATTTAHSLSGGQKRRLSLALAMVKSPRFIFLDEPTSGLDAASAAGVVNALTSLASEANIAILCTIHQPSASVFQRFSHVAILSMGRMAFMGPVDDAVPYFTKAGFPLPPNTNPADHLLDVVNADFSDAENVKKMLAAWAARDVDKEPPLTVSSKKHLLTQVESTIFPHSRYRKSQLTMKALFTRHLPQLLKRSVLLSIRDPHVYWERTIAFVIVGAFIALVYLSTVSRTSDFAIERAMEVGWLLAVPSVLSIVTVHQTSVEHTLLMHETRMGYYHPLSYIIVRTIVELPFMILLAIAVLGIGGYAIAEIPADTFGPMVLLFASLLFSFECLGQLTFVITENVTYGSLCYVAMWFGFFLFSGMWFAVEDVVIVPLRLLLYISPFRLIISSCVYLDFHDVVFSCGDKLSIFTFLSGGGECFGTFYGDNLLDSIGMFVFPGITSDIDVMYSFGITLAIAFTTKALYSGLVVYQAAQHSTLYATKGDEARRPWFVQHKVSILAGLIAMGLVAGLSVYVADNEGSFESECLQGLYNSGFDLQDYDAYPDFFNEDSSVTLPQVGVYEGPDGIEEYLRFALGTTSPYFAEQKTLRLETEYIGYDRSIGQCQFRQMVLLETLTDVTNVKEVNMQMTVANRIQFDLALSKVPRVYIRLDEPFLLFFFDVVLNTNQTRAFICDVMSTNCNNPTADCEARLNALPTLVNGYADSYSSGCRAVHAVFASTNPVHCPHISFDAMLDNRNKSKCQVSENLQESDFFDSSDAKAYHRFQREVGIEPGIGYKLL